MSGRYDVVVGFLMIIGERNKCCVEVELRNVACRILISSSPCCFVVVVEYWHNN